MANFENFIVTKLNRTSLSLGYAYYHSANEVGFVSDLSAAARFPTPESLEELLSMVDVADKGENDFFLCEIVDGGIKVLDQIRDGRWSLIKSTNLTGKLGAVICWHLDGDTNNRGSDKKARASLLSRLAKIIEHKWSEVPFLSDLHDALGEYPQRDAELETLYRAVSKEWFRQVRLPSEPITAEVA